MNIAQISDSLDIVIYNSGVLNGIGNILEVGIEPLKENVNINVYGTYYAAVEFVPLLLKSTYGGKTFAIISSSFGSMQLSDKIAAAHEKFFGPGFDATAMYNVSKVGEMKCTSQILTNQTYRRLSIV